MNIQSVIFDLDGTLFNSIDDIAYANNLMLKHNNFPIHSIESYVNWIGDGAMKLVLKSLPDDIRSTDNNTLDGYLAEYTELYAQNIDVESRLYDGIPDLLDFLMQTNMPMSINTNKPNDLTMRVASGYLKNWNFRFIIGQQPGYNRKPMPDAALYIAEKLNIKPENTLFVGDSVVDLNTGVNAGMMTMGVTWGYGTINENSGFDILVDRPAETIEFLEINSQNA